MVIEKEESRVWLQCFRFGQLGGENSAVHPARMCRGQFRW